MARAISRGYYVHPGSDGTYKNYLPGEARREVFLDFNVNRVMEKYDLLLEKQKQGSLTKEEQKSLDIYNALNQKFNDIKSGNLAAGEEGAEDNYVLTDRKQTAVTSVSSNNIYSGFPMAEYELFNVGNFSTSLNAGVGVSLHDVKYQSSVEYTDSIVGVEMFKGSKSYSGSKKSTTLAYTVGVTPMYKINDNVSLGLYINYTHLDTPSNINFDNNTIKFNNKGNVNTNLAIKYSF